MTARRTCSLACVPDRCSEVRRRRSTTIAARVAGTRAVARPLGHWPLRRSWEKGKLTNEAATSGVSAQAAGYRGRTTEARNVRPIGQIMPPMTIDDRLAVSVTPPGTSATALCQPAG